MGVVSIISFADIKKIVSNTISALSSIHQPTKSIGIPIKYFNTTVNIKRKTTISDDVGDLEEIVFVTQYNIPANIQPFSGEDISQEQGRIRNYTHRAFLPKVIIRMNIEEIINIREDDMVYDQKTKYTYRIRQIEDMIPARKNKNSSKYNHYELLLEKINDSRYAN